MSYKKVVLRLKKIKLCIFESSHFKNLPAKYIKVFNIIKKSKVFQRDYYLSQIKESNELVNYSDDELLLHYLSLGWKQGVNPHPLFSVHWYLEQYEDVRKSQINPLIHYILHGWKEGREPHPLFSGALYHRYYSDTSKLNPLVHYLNYGIKEERKSWSVGN